MEKKQDIDKRIVGFDLLKILAALFVIILHIDGYITQSMDSVVNSDIEFGFIILESIAYPAIHLFVLCGSYLMVEKSIRIKQYIYIYLSTLMITVIGLGISLAIMREKVNITNFLQCIFPFSFRAYGFVSTYIVLMLLSPFINRLIKRLDKNIYRKLIVVSGIPVILLPTVLYGVWESSSLPLYIWLYLVAGYARYHSESFFSFKRGLIIWGGVCISLILSFYVFKFFSFFSILNRGNLQYFYHYNSLLVVWMAIALFMAFGGIKIKNGKLLKILSGFTLIVYELHMHPIIKTKYVEWLLKVICLNSAGHYLISVLSLCAIVFSIACLISSIILKPIKTASNSIGEVIINKWRIIK